LFFVAWSGSGETFFPALESGVKNAVVPGGREEAGGLVVGREMDSTGGGGGGARLSLMGSLYPTHAAMKPRHGWGTRQLATGGNG
jgi:hypothetical protein